VFNVIMTISVILNIGMLVLCGLMQMSYPLGQVLVMVITMLNISGILIKSCILDKGFDNDLKYITIWWLCCLTIGDKPKKKQKALVSIDLIAKQFKLP
jgi:hypothetical protein